MESPLNSAYQSVFFGVRVNVGVNVKNSSADGQPTTVVRCVLGAPSVLSGQRLVIRWVVIGRSSI
eukprot:scaffold11527_cov105-Skeletonema_dohrnii-CCMP3373.AAC.10